MKVVLFCGGKGMRLREYSEDIPKPMVPIGYRPILWHVMKYYAHYGHKDFVLCLGYKGDVIKNYFLNYNECLSNDFILEKGGKEIHLLHRDIEDWKITFADTGLTANIGQRLKAVQKYLNGEDEFLCNYSDGLSDLPLNDFIEDFRRRGKIASMVAVRPSYSFHVISEDETGAISGIQHLSKCGIWINGGYFIFRKEIFEYIREGEELVNEPFNRLIRDRSLIAYKYDGFWASMDTFKDKQLLEEMYSRGEAPWEIWKSFT